MSLAVGSSNLSVVRSGLYDGFPGVTFGLSTRRGGTSKGSFGLNLSFRVGDDEGSVQANRELFFGSLGVPLDRLAIPTQVHGSSVQVAQRPGTFAGCDGLISDERGVYLAISVADCVPVFLYDPVRPAVAAIHAGWRGSRLGIVATGLDQMRTQFGSVPSDLRVVIGQSAGACCYEVGDEVAREFAEQFIVRRAGKKPHLDLHAYTLDLLHAFGVRREHVEMLTACTICHPEEFHSYRRDGSRSGRMMGVIGLRDAPAAPGT